MVLLQLGTFYLDSFTSDLFFITWLRKKKKKEEKSQFLLSLALFQTIKESHGERQGELQGTAHFHGAPCQQRVLGDHRDAHKPT